MTATIDIYDPDGYVGGPAARAVRRAAPHAAGLLAGHARRARVTGRCSSTPTSCTSPASRRCSRRARAAWCSRTSRPRQLEGCAMMLLAMDPPRHVDVPPAARPELQGARDRRRWRTASARSAARSCERRGRAGRRRVRARRHRARCRRRSSASSWACPSEDWRRDPHVAERNTSSQDPEIMATADADAATARSIDMAMYAIQFAAERRSQEPARRPHLADPRRPTSAARR